MLPVLIALALVGQDAGWDGGVKGLGSATLLADAGTCGGSLATDRCDRVSVSCPGVDTLVATLKVTEPRNDAGVPQTSEGTLVTGIGGGGTAPYETMTYGGAEVLTPALNRLWRVVQQSWDSGTNTQGVWGGSAGPTYGGDSVPDNPVDRGCLAATLLAYINSRPELHRSGTLLAGTGQSGSSSAFGYAMGWYGAGDLLSCVTLSGGPPIGLIKEGCMGSLDPTWAAECATYTGTGGGGCGFTPGATSGGFVDNIANDGRSSCTVHAKGGSVDWDSWSLTAAAAVKTFPLTDINFVYADTDNSEAPKLGRGYAARITSLGAAPQQVITTVGAGCAHAVPSCQTGAQAINTTFAGGTYNGVTFDACINRH